METNSVEIRQLKTQLDSYKGQETLNLQDIRF